MDQNQSDNSFDYGPSVVRETSMGTLIMWNISKVVKSNPQLDLQSAIRETQERLLGNANGSLNILQEAEDQYLLCAILAWQRLGHHGCDSLYKFIETKRKEQEQVTEKLKEERSLTLKKKIEPNRLSPGSFISYNDPNMSGGHHSTYYDAVGPVVKLPVNTKVVMRLDTTAQPAKAPLKKPENVLMNNLDVGCCMESKCMERLKQLDQETAELRTRALRLAKREAQRVELLEKAEASWKDLEMGYQRRLAAAEEKEEDMSKQIQELILERNAHKTACTELANVLKEKGDAAEQQQNLLSELEKEVCDCGCDRLRLSEESAQLEAELAELHCKIAQLDRDLQFKEEEVRGRLQNMENEVDCARALTYEAERTIHAELSALRDQIVTVSDQLLGEDEVNNCIKEELEQLRQDKAELLEDLDGCQALCNKATEWKVKELNTKREQLQKLKEKVLECRCKYPVDASVEVKRTPSLVALCRCTPEDKVLDSCSCTSLRTTLLSNLLSDLFGGLLSELGDCSARMPCQLLKCLEDKHNWDRPSDIKTNLENYFTKLLAGELDIAIATSIENYHARWVGTSCADALREISTCCGGGRDNSPNRVIERKAQQLATKLAEELFQERADELTVKAKEVFDSLPPPCECGGTSTVASKEKGVGKDQKSAAVYPCLVREHVRARPQSPGGASAGVVTSAHWRRTHQNVARLKEQLEDLKKVSIKKEDLKMMEENIVKIVQRTITEATPEDKAITKFIDTQNTKSKKDSTSVYKTNNQVQVSQYLPSTKLSTIKKKQSDVNRPKPAKKNIVFGLRMEKPEKPLKSLYPSYAVNLCLCGSGMQNQDYFQSRESMKPIKGAITSEALSKPSNVQVKKEIVKQMHSDDMSDRKIRNLNHPYCRSDVACFHKPPSNTSIDNLLSALSRWKSNLVKFNNKNDKCEVIHDGGPEIKNCENNSQTIDEKFTNDKVSAKTSINQTDPLFPKEVAVNVSEVALQNDLPVNTNSEYMGAINLEKSNENFCKCVIDTKNVLKSPFTCINSSSCNCYHETKNEKDANIKSRYEQKTENDMSFKHRQPGTPAESNIPLYESNGDIKKEKAVHSKEKVYDHGVNHITKPSPLFPDDSEYCITFLGVALKNNTSRQDLSGQDNACYNMHHTKIQKKDRKLRKQAEKPYDSRHIEGEKSTDQCNADDTNNSNALNSPQNPIKSCDCHVKCDEFKSFIMSLMSKQGENFINNVDKALDTSSLKASKGDTCICCNATKTDESKDLEVNVFHLLKEYLKDKLDEFKNTTCKSKCIPSSEEEKLLSTILQRVRQVISDSTLKVACKCVNESLSEGSWHRAYILLQEYLKMKIKRVQCLCQLPEKSKDEVFPDVLDKVCNLIDNDFKRLKDLCKCNSVGDEAARNLDNGAQIELPEKDTNDFIRPKNDKGTSNKSILPIETRESQVSSNLGLNTGIYDPNTRTTNNPYSGGGTQNTFPIPKNVIDPHSEFVTNNMTINPCIHNILKEDTINPIELKKSKDLDSTTFKNISGENVSSQYSSYRKRSSPYIGYTIECSCGKILGNCSCFKSLVSENTENINSIWTAVTTNRLNLKSHSYIMNAVPITSLNMIDKSDLNEANPKTKCAKKLRDATLSVYDDQDMTLKVSKEKLGKSGIPDITYEDNVCREAVEGPIDWCESSTKTKSPKETYNSDGNLSGSLYYPINNLMNRKRNDHKEKSDTVNYLRNLSSNCECNMVPMCHVKMLVENIEKRLIYSKCTCDSLCPNVCPEHSKKNLEN